MSYLYCFVLHLQTHAAEGLPISDGGNLTILQDWEQAGLLPSNRVNFVLLLREGNIFMLSGKSGRLTSSITLKYSSVGNLVDYTFRNNVCVKP